MFRITITHVSHAYKYSALIKKKKKKVSTMKMYQISLYIYYIIVVKNLRKDFQQNSRTKCI